MSGGDSKQDFTLDFQPAGYGLRVHVQGVNGTLETTVAYWLGIAEEVRKRRPRGLLVVDDMEGDPPPEEDLMRFVQSMRGEGFEDVRIAYVERHAHQIPDVELASIMANEHGFAARVFDNEADAERWLRYGERRFNHRD